MDLARIIPNFGTIVLVKGKRMPVSNMKAYFTVEKSGQVAFDFDKTEATEAKEDGTYDLSERQKSVFNYLKQEFSKGATAKELSVAMHKNNLVPSPERNSVHPRLRELIKLDLVKVIGKKTCQFTDRTVSIYKTI